MNTLGNLMNYFIFLEGHNKTYVIRNGTPENIKNLAIERLVDEGLIVETYTLISGKTIMAYDVDIRDENVYVRPSTLIFYDKMMRQYIKTDIVLRSQLASIVGEFEFIFISEGSMNLHNEERHKQQQYPDWLERRTGYDGKLCIILIDPGFAFPTDYKQIYNYMNLKLIESKDRPVQIRIYEKDKEKDLKGKFPGGSEFEVPPNIRVITIAGHLNKSSDCISKIIKPGTEDDMICFKIMDALNLVRGGETSVFRELYFQNWTGMDFVAIDKNGKYVSINDRRIIGGKYRKRFKGRKTLKKRYRRN